MKKRHVMRALVAAATALALTACGSTGSSDTSKSTSTQLHQQHPLHRPHPVRKQIRRIPSRFRQASRYPRIQMLRQW